MIVIFLMSNYSGDIVVIFSVNSTDEKLRDVDGVVPYRCDRIVFMVILTMLLPLACYFGGQTNVF